MDDECMAPYSPSWGNPPSSGDLLKFMQMDNSSPLQIEFKTAHYMSPHYAFHSLQGFILRMYIAEEREAFRVQYISKTQLK